MINIPKVIELVVDNDLCIGCGLCTYKCPSDALKMDWNEDGFLVPFQIDNCDTCELESNCISVCPFNPFPDENVKTENEISDIFLSESSFRDKQIGKYNSIYTGYSKDYRLTSSSGGIGTYVLDQLLSKGIVDHVFSVKEGGENSFYQYSISSNRQELLKTSKTRYFPVTLSNVFSELDKIEGRVAIVGVACFIKAIRLAQISDKSLKKKIPFLVGIICGGVKSNFFTEYLADSSGVKVSAINKPEYRIKNTKSSAGDYSFGCIDEISKKESRIKMSTVGDMWGTGLFKANACDFCDDVTTELADISVGDAWIQPHVLDGKGTNVIVSRSKISELILNAGLRNGQLFLEELSKEKMINSQKGSFNHRQLTLPYRINKAKKNNIPVPPKRVSNSKISLNLKIVQDYRMKARSKSFEIWKKSRKSKDFNRDMKNLLFILRKVTKVNHYMRTLFSKNLGKAAKRKVLKYMDRFNF